MVPLEASRPILQGLLHLGFPFRISYLNLHQIVTLHWDHTLDPAIHQCLRAEIRTAFPAQMQQSQVMVGLQDCRIQSSCATCKLKPCAQMNPY